MQINIANHDYTIVWDGVYYFAMSDYPNITPWELKKIITFIDYERKHGRETEILCEDEKIQASIRDAITNPEALFHVSVPVKITECTACKQHGCLTKFVCHTATAENAMHILASGKLLSAVKVFGKTGDELVLDKRNTIGDPADYFEYIMFAWGNCQAGDRLVMERSLGRNPTDEELEKSLTPGVRFYFRHEDIIRHPGYVFDGYHPAKIKDELELSDNLYACIVPEQYRSELMNHVKSEIANRVFYLPQDGLGVWDWAEKVYDFVVGL